MRGWRPLAGLPAVARWTLLGVGGGLVAVLIAAGAWALVQHRAAAAHHAFIQAAATYRHATGGGDQARLGDGVTGLKQFLKDYPRSRDAAEAWYYLGNLEYGQGSHDAALAAFAEAAARDRASVGALSRLGAGYAWEAKKDLARALAVYQEALTGRGPKHFLYAELLLASGRVQEELQQPGAAVESYRRLLKDAPDSPRADEARTRLALLGAGPG